jgi:Na+-translocating ferredoxin:NAD+ oxidoreductase RnfG subunit
MVLNILLILVATSSFTIQERTLYSITKRRTDKVLNKYWQDEEFNMTRAKLNPGQPEIYKVQQGNSSPFAYVLFAEAPSKVDTFIYLVVFNSDAAIEKVAVLLYRENYGGEIASNRFLRQFEGKSNGINMEYNKEIDGISGATLSVRSISRALKNDSKMFYELISEL